MFDKSNQPQDDELDVYILEDEFGEKSNFVLLDDNFAINGNNYILLMPQDADLDAPAELYVFKKVIKNDEEMLEQVEGKEYDDVTDVFLTIVDEIEEEYGL